MLLPLTLTALRFGVAVPFAVGVVLVLVSLALTMVSRPKAEPQT